MAHQIERNDGLVMHRRGAWHGLGITTDEEFTPLEGLKLADLDYGMIQKALYTKNSMGEFVQETTHVANYRADEDLLLGIVTSGYYPVTNYDMAVFCENLIEEGQVKCETVGSVQNGKKVWFLLKGEDFEVANGDGIMPYCLVSNGHDQKTSFRVTPTTVRAVCSNTLHMVIPRTDTGELGKSAIVLHHTQNIMERIEEARAAIRHYNLATEETKQVIKTLSTKDMNHEDVQQFFLESYTADFGEIPANPQNKIEHNQRDRAMSALGSFSQRFDDERSIAGASMWNAYNAYSGLIQHDKKARGKDDPDRVEKRVYSNMFGLNSTRCENALQRAYSAAV